MRSLYDPERVQEIHDRAARLTPDSARDWGTMTVSQGLEHMAKSLRMAVGEDRTPRLFVGRLLADWSRTWSSATTSPCTATPPPLRAWWSRATPTSKPSAPRCSRWSTASKPQVPADAPPTPTPSSESSPPKNGAPWSTSTWTTTSANSESRHDLSTPRPRSEGGPGGRSPARKACIPVPRTVYCILFRIQIGGTPWNEER